MDLQRSSLSPSSSSVQTASDVGVSIRSLLFLVALFLVGATTVPAQSPDAPSPDDLPPEGRSPYETCAYRTGETATIIVPTDARLLLDGTALSPGDQLAVFTTEGVCAGTLAVRNEHAVLTLWGDNSMTSEPDGLRPGEALSFHVWDASAGMEYTASNSRFSVSFRTDAPHLTRESRYVPNGIYVLNHLAVESIGHAATNP